MILKEILFLAIFPDEISLKYPRTFLELLALIYLLHYGDLPLLLKAEIQLCLEGEVEKRCRPFEQRVTLSSLLRNRFQLLAYLGKQNDRWLFGQFSVAIHRSVRTLKIRTVRRAMPPQRDNIGRGHNDHSTLPLAHQWKEKHDFSFTELQQELEAEDHIAAVLSYSELEHYISRREQGASEGGSQSALLEQHSGDNKKESNHDSFERSSHFTDSHESVRNDYSHVKRFSAV